MCLSWYVLIPFTFVKDKIDRSIRMHFIFTFLTVDVFDTLLVFIINQ